MVPFKPSLMSQIRQVFNGKSGLFEEMLNANEDFQDAISAVTQDAIKKVQCPTEIPISIMESDFERQETKITSQENIENYFSPIAILERNFDVQETAIITSDLAENQGGLKTNVAEKELISLDAPDPLIESTEILKPYDDEVNPTGLEIGMRELGDKNENHIVNDFENVVEHFEVEDINVIKGIENSENVEDEVNTVTPSNSANSISKLC